MLGGMGQTNQSMLYADILKSRAVAVYIDNQIGLSKSSELSNANKEMLYDFIRSILEVKIEKSGLVRITATYGTSFFPSSIQQDSAAVIAARITNEAINALDQIIRNKNISSAKFSKQYIEGEIANYKVKLDSVENSLEEFQRTNRVLAIDEQTLAIVKQAIDIGSELAKAEIELNLAKHDFNAKSQTVKALKSNVDYLKKQYHNVQSGGLTETDAFSFPLIKAPQLARQYAGLFRDRKILEQVLIYLETQRHQEAIQEQRDIPLVEVLDEAVPPETRISPSRKLMVILGFALSLFFAISIVTVKAVYLGYKKN